MIINRRVVAALTGLAVALPVGFSAITHAWAAPRSTTPQPQPYPVLSSLAKLVTVGQLVVANQLLFVSSGPSGSAVNVYMASGSLVTQITGIPGADGMTVSPDGDSVYVAESSPTGSGIAVIDTADFTVSTVAAGACPQSLAYADGRVFYSYGCSGGAADGYGFGSFDAATDTQGAMITGLASAPLLAGDGDPNVVSTDVGTTLSTYTTTADGSLSRVDAITLSAAPDAITESPNGDEVMAAVRSDPDVTAYSTATLTPVATYDTTAAPTAVAEDPSATNVAVGTEGYAETAALFAAMSSTPTWARFTTDGNPADWRTNASEDRVLPGTMAFSADGAEVFALVSRGTQAGIYLLAADSAPASPTRTTAASPKVGFGKPLQVFTHVAGLGGLALPVRFTLTHGKSTSTKQRRTTSTGKAATSFRPLYSGRLSVAFEGSASLLPSAALRSYSVASKTICQLRGSHRSRHGIATYSSARNIEVYFLTKPEQAARHATAVIQAYKRGKWRFVKQLKGTEKRHGVVVTFDSAPALEKLRVRFATPTDVDSRGSKITSPVFELD